MVLDSSDEEFINDHVNQYFAAQEKAAGINQKKKCKKCSQEVVHRTCGSCNLIQCKDCNKHFQCPGCDKWYCEKGCCSSGDSAGVYYCGECGVICEGCITFLYEDFTLMDTCCTECKKRIPPFYKSVKSKEERKCNED